MKIQTLLFLASLFILSMNSCQQESKEYIKPIDFELYQPDVTQGRTVKESRLNIIRTDSAVKSNTINKYLPEIKVQNKQGEEVNLQDEVHGKSFILIADMNYGLADQVFFKYLPEVLDSLKRAQIELNYYPIYSTNGIETSADSVLFNKKLDQIKKLYPNYYTITKEEGLKLNQMAGLLKLYLNQDQLVLKTEWTHFPDGYLPLYQEIVENLDLK